MLELIKTKKALVEDILHHVPQTRDCDRALYYVYLKIEVEHIPVTDMALQKYALAVSKEGVSPPETISRSRRKIQHEQGLYVGTRKNKRKAAAQQVREGINSI